MSHKLYWWISERRESPGFRELIFKVWNWILRLQIYSLLWNWSQTDELSSKRSQQFWSVKSKQTKWKNQQKVWEKQDTPWNNCSNVFTTMSPCWTKASSMCIRRSLMTSATTTEGFSSWMHLKAYGHITLKQRFRTITEVKQRDRAIGESIYSDQYIDGWLLGNTSSGGFGRAGGVMLGNVNRRAEFRFHSGPFYSLTRK